MIDHQANTQGILASRVSPAALLVLLVLGVSLLTGCITHQVSVTVPVMENPRAQYMKANDYMNQCNLPLISDDRKYETARETVRQTFAKVVEYFPEDRSYTPLAKLQIIEMEAGLDSERVRVPASKIRDAIDKLVMLAQEYPEFEFIQVKALYQEGQCHRLLKQYSDAQECFRLVRDDYKSNQDPYIQDMVDKAAYFYNKVEVVQ